MCSVVRTAPVLCRQISRPHVLVFWKERVLRWGPRYDWIPGLNKALFVIRHTVLTAGIYLTNGLLLNHYTIRR